MAEKELFPVIEVPDFETQTEEKNASGTSVKWDLEKGDFILDGARRMVPCSGFEAYQTWCYKVCQTERFAYLAYPDTLGVELEDARKEPTKEAVESAMERTITEALMENPCTEYVRGFSFSWEKDTVLCKFTVKSYDNNEFTVKID